VVGSCECGDESLGSGTMELVSVCIIMLLSLVSFMQKQMAFLFTNRNHFTQCMQEGKDIFVIYCFH
jgi:hypothetical protein